MFLERFVERSPHLDEFLSCLGHAAVDPSRHLQLGAEELGHGLRPERFLRAFP